jgi:hypothetical protein
VYFELPAAGRVSFSERKPTAWLREVLSGMRNSLPTKSMFSDEGRMPLKSGGVGVGTSRRVAARAEQQDLAAVQRVPDGADELGLHGR